MHHCGKSRSSATFLNMVNGGSTFAIRVFLIVKVTPLLLSRAGVVQRTAHDRLVYIDVTVPDFQVVAAIRISTNPGFKLD